MDNSLLIYLNKRLQEESSFKKYNPISGPVITISREVGCSALKLANLLANRLNEHKMDSAWKVLSKEIFYQSAKELDMDPERVRRIVKQTGKHTFNEILNAFNDKQFKSERRIINTITDVVRSFADDGFSIIVGRAGNIIARDIKNTLHIRLVAPLEYRLHNVMENNKLNRVEALGFIQRVEKERIAFRKAINQNKESDELYDLIINRAVFSDDEIIDIIEFAVEKKKLLKGHRQRMEFF
jgi:cytidylate kinase